MEYKIFIGLTEIAGYYGNLKQGFQQIGVDCTFINLDYHPHQYGGDDEPNILVKMYKWNRNQKRNYNYKLLKAPFFAFEFILKVSIFIWALYHYNVFLFGFGMSFFRQHLDLPILKFFNKKVIFTFFGSDERPPYINGAITRSNPTLEDYKRLSHKIKFNILSIEKHADYIVAHSASAHFHQKKFIPGLLIGFPFSSLAHKNCIQTKTKNIRILHSPSDPIAKGSTNIRAAISKLEKRGYSINFIEMTGKPNHEVHKMLQECDFVVDQIYSDTPMAGFATEAGWFGKPAVVGGYCVEHIHNYYPPEKIPPSLYCHPDEITSTIERLIVDEEYRQQLGRKSQEFVRTQWTPEQVARRYLQIIEGTIQGECMFDPNTIRYLQGGGLPESQSKEIIKSMIETYGIESLCLSDKPELEQRFKEYAYDIHK